MPTEWDDQPDYYTVEVGFFRPQLQQALQDRDELAASLRKVTAKLREMDSAGPDELAYLTHTNDTGEKEVLEAEALLKRIDGP